MKIKGSSSSLSLCWLILVLDSMEFFPFVSSQLPDDIQRELNQNLAEQARLQALQQRQQHQRQLIQNRAGSQHHQQQPQPQQPQQQAHDPNNYSYQQVSPPIQYSYYQPFGDAAAPQQQQQQPAAQSQSNQQQAAAPANFDLNNLNLDDLPTPQAQVSSQPASSGAASPQQVHMTPSFTGVGGLPVMKPVAGQAPLAPQARVQQGPPLTEADFKDITGGENYGAPGGNDFGLGDASTGNGRAGGSDNTDAQLREFGLPTSGGGGGNNRRIDTSAQNMNIPDFGAFNPIGATRQRSQPAAARNDPTAGGFGDFGNLGGMGGGGGSGGSPQRQAGEFDFASLPSSSQGDQASATLNGGAPGSLQSLLGSGFPGLGGAGNGNGANGNGGQAGSGLDGFASGGNDPQAQPQSRLGDGSMDIADLGDKSDQFSGADLGGFEQPNPGNDQDFNYAAASQQQPSSVPYPDGSPQPVGTIFALTQPQSLSQTRYSALPDKGTYQDYPAYQAEGDHMTGVADSVDSTPKARQPGPGRYGAPAVEQLAPEYRRQVGPGKAYDYGLAPRQGQR